MAGTTVRLSQDAKNRLDRLQARLTLLAGRGLTKEEVLDKAIQHAERAPAHILDDDWTPGTPEGLARLLSLPISTGPRTHAKDIDRDLYGDDL